MARISTETPQAQGGRRRPVVDAESAAPPLTRRSLLRLAGGLAGGLCLTAGCARMVEGRPVEAAGGSPAPTPEQLGHPGIREVRDSVSIGRLLAMLGGNLRPGDLTGCMRENYARPGTENPMIVTSGLWLQRRTDFQVLVSVLADPLIPNLREPGAAYNQSLAALEDSLDRRNPDYATKAAVYNTEQLSGLSIYSRKLPFIEGSYEDTIRGISTTGGPYTVAVRMTSGRRDPLPLEGVNSSRWDSALHRVNKFMQDIVPALVSASVLQQSPPPR